VRNRVIVPRGGASEPSNTLLPGKVGGTVAVRRTLASTIRRIADPTQVARPRQLRDASAVRRFRPAHQRKSPQTNGICERFQRSRRAGLGFHPELEP
jgi:hypothetical protein